MTLSFRQITLFFKSYSLSKNLLLSGSIVFLFVAIYLSASWGITHASVIKPRQVMMLWTNKKQPFNEEKWRSSIITMEASIESNSNNAQNYFDLARLYEWKAYQKPIWNSVSITNRSKAIFYYKKSLEHRPTWSSAWINLAMSKTLNMEFGDDAKSALSNAITYGAWESGVFNKIVWLSLANWDGLPLAIQEQVKSLIQKTMDKKGRVPLYVIETAKYFNWTEELQAVIKESLRS